METAERLDKLFSKFPRTPVHPQDVIYSPGRSPDYITYLKRGLVKQWEVDSSGQVLILQIYKPGTIFPLHHVCVHRPIRHFFQTLTEGVVIKIPVSEFRRAVDTNLWLAKEINVRLGNAVLGLSERLACTNLGNSRHKVIWTLLLLSQRFGHLMQGRIIIDLSLSHYELASWSGLTRETVSLQLEKLKQENMISYSPRKITICNPSAFAKIADS